MEYCYVFVNNEISHDNIDTVIIAANKKEAVKKFVKFHEQEIDDFQMSEKEFVSMYDVNEIRLIK